jgi:hypothetical protein
MVETNLPTEVSNKVERSLLNGITNANQIKDIAAQHILAPFNVPTPKEKIKKRPDGFDYVEGTWMDHVAKELMPLYKYKLLHISWELGWINIVVSLKDRITGNTEIGAGSARVHVRQGIESPGFKDVIDMGNNLKSALTQAIKNAQSRFGVAADVYGKRESTPTNDERTRFQEMLAQINEISKTKSHIFEEQWKTLGTDFTDFLDKWQVFIKMKSNPSGAQSSSGQKTKLEL